MPENYTDDFEGVKASERARIDAQRRARGNEKSDIFALCLSGGGIRSASFALGVIQALLRRGELKNVDYLSTVSGGGYIGSALSWLLSASSEATVNPTSETDYFPLGSRQRGARHADGHDALNYIRQHGDYLNPGQGINLISLFGVVVRSIIVSVVIYFSILSFLMLMMHSLEVTLIMWFKEVQHIEEFWIPDGALYMAFAVVVAVLIVTSYFVFAVATWWSALFHARTYTLRVLTERIVGRLWTLMLILALLGSLPFAAKGINWIVLSYESGSFQGGLLSGLVGSRIPDSFEATGVIQPGLHFTIAIGSILLSLIGGYFSRWAKSVEEATDSGIVNRLFVWAFLLLFVYGIFLLAHSVSYHVFCTEVAQACNFGGGRPIFWGNFLSASLWFLLPGVILGFFADLNHLSLHQMYRDRLMEEFMPGPAAIASNSWILDKEANRSALSEFSGREVAGPYHVLNSNLILVDSRKAKFRGRGGDSFILSPLYSGSDATGWQTTESYMNNRMTLATAMAISGAAANPDAGLSGQGFTMSRLVSILMFLFNMRLGYWAPNPAMTHASSLYRIPPSYLYPGLVQGLLGIGLDAEHRHLQLSDGGHFDNLGLYEMIRRKVPVILVSDAGADPKYTFESLGTALERVRVDFGANVNFNDGNYDLMGIVPGSGPKSIATERYGLARNPFAIGSITYADNSSGLLIYLRTSLCEGLPQDIYGYKSAHPTYPNESTADQFFDEAQVEAYRELGYRLTLKMLDANQKQEWF